MILSITPSYIVSKHHQPPPSARDSRDAFAEAQAAIRDMWPELEAQGYRMKEPRDLDNHSYYIKPNASLRGGVRGVDFFHGPIDFLQHLRDTRSSVPEPGAEDEPMEPDMVVDEKFLTSMIPMLRRIGYTCLPPINKLKTTFMWLTPNTTMDKLRPGNYFENASDFADHLKTIPLSPILKSLADHHSTVQAALKELEPLLQIQGKLSSDGGVRRNQLQARWIGLQDKPSLFEQLCHVAAVTEEGMLGHPGLCRLLERSGYHLLPDGKWQGPSLDTPRTPNAFIQELKTIDLLPFLKSLVREYLTVEEALEELMPLLQLRGLVERQDKTLLISRADSSHQNLLEKLCHISNTTPPK